MKHLRPITIGACAVVIAGAAVASGAVGSVTPPPAKPLAQAIHDAITSKPARGVTARISFTNKLIDSSGISGMAGGTPLLTGATGRIWVSADGHARLELQSDRGDAQITTDGKKVSIYDASSNTAYVATLPAQTADSAAKDIPESTTPPSVAKISDVLAKVAKAADLTGPDPTALAGQGAYSVKLAPHHGGLVGQVELAWDAATGVPLRAGIYAAGATKPTLELAATDISYGPVDDAVLTTPIPAGAKIETIDTGNSDHAATDATPADRAKFKAELVRRKAMTPAEVAAALPFTLSAPEALGGQPRSAVRLVGSGDHTGALVTYGTGLGGIAVLETPAKPADASAATTPAPTGRHHRDAGIKMPSVSVNGGQASELSTALGTLLRFEHGGVQYTVVGSVTSAVAEAAARGL